MAYAKIRPRRGTEYEWSTYNPVLSEGELAIQFPDTGIGKGLCKFKVGDGVTPWNQLAFAFDGTAAAAIDGGGINPTAIIQIRSATANTWYDNNPILAEREIAYDITNKGIKIGDGETRWNDLPFISAGALVDSESAYDFGSEDGEQPMSLSEMEQNVNYNLGYDGNVFDNYHSPRPVIPDTEPDSGDDNLNAAEVDPNNPDDGEDTPGEEENPEEPVVGPEEETPTEEEPVESAGLRDLIADAEENTESKKSSSKKK